MRIEVEESGIRRFVHICLPIFLLYYLVPEDTWMGLDKRAVMLASLLFLLVFESIRLSHQIRIFGLRDYEMDAVGAYLWAGAGLTLVFLLFDISLVVPAVLGMAWVDPLNGVLRSRGSRSYPLMPFICYLTIAATALLLLSTFDPLRIAAISITGAAAGMASEHFKTRFVDDDFLMLIIPVVVMTMVSRF
ncbi:MAG: hypothetical protein ACE5QF_00490 [Thermoplasmata archaeon]